MHDLIKYFETVLNRLILPKFPSLTEIEIMAATITGDEMQDYRPIFRVQVEYFTKNDLKKLEQWEIEKETRSLFNLIGFPENADLRVFFSEKKDNKI